MRSYDLLCVTSPTGADQLFTHLRDARELAGVTVAAIGPGTARALRAHGVEADIVPERAVAEGLVEALDAAAAVRRPPPPRRPAPPRRARRRRAPFPFKRVLVARAAEGRDVLIDALRERGAHVDVVALYETVAEPLDDATRDAASQADYVLFTSGVLRALLRRRGRLARRAAARLDRPRDQRRAARARRRARPRGRPAHAGRPGRRAARGRRIVPGMSLGQPREHHETIGSTNERARELAEEGAAHGTLVTAGEQTAGRGRQGRGWVTPPASRSPPRWSCATTTTCCRCAPGSPSPTSPAPPRA